MGSPVYEKCLKLCTRYFPNNPQVFLDRQVNVHLKKDPDSLAKSDLPELAKWCHISATLLVGQEKAVELSSKIEKV